jgi:thiamine-phosphate pyrophosphorylase
MPLDQRKPITYLITSGETTATTTSLTENFSLILKLVEAAVASGISLVQLREKNLTARVLYQLASHAVEITCGSSTRLLVNDRADVASAAGADGVHLTTRSLTPSIVRRAFGQEFLIGVSTHLLGEARAARASGADFVVFGPVFETASKGSFGEPVGLAELNSVASELLPFPVIALGGVTVDNAVDCLRAGASGVAGISLFKDPVSLVRVRAVICANEKRGKDNH